MWHHNDVIGRNQNLPFLGYIHCNVYLNLHINHGDMKEKVSGCFFCTQCHKSYIIQLNTSVQCVFILYMLDCHTLSLYQISTLIVCSTNLTCFFTLSRPHRSSLCRWRTLNKAVTGTQLWQGRSQLGFEPFLHQRLLALYPNKRKCCVFCYD